MSVGVAKPAEITLIAFFHFDSRDQLESYQEQINQLNNSKGICISKGDTETLNSISSDMNTIWVLL